MKFCQFTFSKRTYSNIFAYWCSKLDGLEKYAHWMTQKKQQQWASSLHGKSSKAFPFNEETTNFHCLHRKLKQILHPSNKRWNEAFYNHLSGMGPFVRFCFIFDVATYYWFNTWLHYFCRRCSIIVYFFYSFVCVLVFHLPGKSWGNFVELVLLCFCLFLRNKSNRLQYIKTHDTIWLLDYESGSFPLVRFITNGWVLQQKCMHQQSWSH